MKNLKKCLAMSFFIFFINAGSVLAHGIVYEGELKCSTDEDISIIKVAIDQNKTVISLRLTNSDKEPVFAFLNPVGSPGAFVLKELSSGKKFTVKASSGLPILPDQREIASGSSVEFSLTFDAIDPESRFDLIEGDINDDMIDVILWHFKNVDLGQMNKIM